MQKAELMELLMELARKDQVKGTKLSDHPCVVAMRAIDRTFDDINFLLKIARGATYLTKENRGQFLIKLTYNPDF